MDTVRITVIVENSAGRGKLLGEHGLSFWIETAGKRILFDAGQGYAFANNVRELGLPIADVDALILSHGHYDHAGGLVDALAMLPARRPMWLHPAAFEPKMARHEDGTVRFIGLADEVRQAIETRADVIQTEDPVDIFGRVRLTGYIPRQTDFEDTGGAFFHDSACLEADELRDDQAAFIDTPAGLVVLLGCAHSGVINTLHHIRELSGNRPVHTVIGGMHLMHADTERIERTIAALRAYGVRSLRPCHCTGFAAAARLWNAFPGQCAPCPVGTVLEVPAE